MTQGINYGKLMHRAMRGLIEDVLLEVQQTGLPGEHHFFITFDTNHPHVEMAEWLKDRYPTEMTVVMQHWYEGLDVTEEGFGVTLNFGDAPERLYVPYNAIKTFVDPSVEFGLRFDSQDGDEEAEDEDTPPTDDDPDGGLPEPETRQDAEVVSLDRFRK